MKVLIGIDGGESAEIVLNEAKKILTGFSGAEVEVFTVIDISNIAVGQGFDNTLLGETMERQAHELEGVATRILGEKTFTFSTETGYPIEQILERVTEINCDLLIIGTHGRTGLDHLLIGSVAEKVIRLSPCNTLVIPVKGKLSKK